MTQHHSGRILCAVVSLLFAIQAGVELYAHPQPLVRGECAFLCNVSPDQKGCLCYLSFIGPTALSIGTSNQFMVYEVAKRRFSTSVPLRDEGILAFDRVPGWVVYGGGGKTSKGFISLIDGEGKTGRFVTFAQDSAIDRAIYDAKTDRLFAIYRPNALETDYSLRAWDRKSKQELHLPRFLTDKASCISRTVDGRKMAIGYYTGEVKLVTDDHFEANSDLLKHHGPVYFSLQFSIDGKWLLSAPWHPNEPLVVTDVVDKKHVRSIAILEKTINCASFDPSSYYVATGTNDGVIRVWSIQTGNEVCATGAVHPKGVDLLSFSPDGRLLASVGLGESTVKLWRIKLNR